MTESPEQPEVEHKDWYFPGPSMDQFHESNAFVRVLIGARGCIRGDTPIYDPLTRTSLTVQERANRAESFHVLSLTHQGVQVCQGLRPFLKGSCRLWRVISEGLQPLYCSPEHKFLTPSGWKPLSSLSSGQIVASFDNLPLSTLDTCQEALTQGVRRYPEIAQDYPGDYCYSVHPCDGPLLSEAIDGLVSSPSPGDALAHIQSGSRQGDYSSLGEHTRACLQSDRRSKTHSFPSCGPCLVAGGVDLSQDAEESPIQSSVYESSPRSLPLFGPHPERLTESGKALSLHHDLEQILGTFPDSIRWVRIVKEETAESAAYYDLTVPGASNYYAAGYWHHNSGKTTGVTVDVIGHCWHNAGAKCMLIRKTEASQEDTTVATMGICFENMGELYKDTGYSLFKSWNNGRTFRLPSRKAVEAFNEAAPQWKTKGDRIRWLETEGNRLCGFVESRGLPNGQVSQSKLRGFECSMMVHVEADQIDRKSFDLSFACLRWKGSDPDVCDKKGFILDRSMIIDTNPPSPTHWIALMEQDEAEKPEHDKRMEFWHISTYENEHNLPPNYIRDTILLPYAKNPAMIERMLWGRYADAFDGSAVLYAYRPEYHESRNLGWPRGATLVVGMDVGTNNASVISAYKVYNGHLYFWTLREIVLTGSDTDRQCVELLKVLANEFPFWNTASDICPQTLFFCDPAARNSAYTAQGPTSSALKVLQSHGIFPGMKTGVHLQPSIAACNRLLTQRHEVETTATVENPDGKATIWHFKIDADKCPILKRGHSGEYRYPSLGEPGYGNDQPLKGALCNHVDHVEDSWRYSIINVLDIAQETYGPGMTTNMPAVSNAEPKRTI